MVFGCFLSCPTPRDAGRNTFVSGAALASLVYLPIKHTCAGLSRSSQNSELLHKFSAETRKKDPGSAQAGNAEVTVRSGACGAFPVTASQPSLALLPVLGSDPDSQRFCPFCFPLPCLLWEKKPPTTRPAQHQDCRFS